MGIFVTKFLMFGELPSLTDSTFIFFLCLHFTSFIYFHSNEGSCLLKRYHKNPYRKIFQETFKGYGKGMKLFLLILKGVQLKFNIYYFLIVLLARGCASSFYTSLTLKFLTKEHIRLNKVKTNTIFIVVPCIVTFLYYEAHGMGSLDEEKTSLLCFLFIGYQMINRTVRVIYKISQRNQRKSQNDCKIATKVGSQNLYMSNEHEKVPDEKEEKEESG